MKVLFINPWQKTLFGDEKARPGHPHLGLAYLVAVLKKAGHSCAVFDQGLENDDDLLFRRLHDWQPDLVGITSFSFSIDYAADLIRRIKEVSDVPVIIGGAHVSAVRERVLEETVADFAMYGECETAILDFLVQLGGERDFAKVPNLIRRTEECGLVANPATAMISELDDLPYPDFEAFEFERYNYYSAKALPIITSRGCPYKCNYCSVKLSMGRGFRKRNPESIVDEMEFWKKRYGIRRFEVNDDCFSLDLKRAEAICDLIIERKLGITYEMYNGIRADRVSEVLLRKMKASGCVFVSFGCESGDQEIVYNMGKKLKLEDVRNAVELTRKVGIRNSVNFIVGHRNETFEAFQRTLDFAASLPTDFVNFYNLVPYPGTEVYEWMKAEARQLIPDQEFLSRIGSRNFEPVYETDEFPRADRIRAMELGNALYEKTVLIYRFGRVAGTLAYLVSRNRTLFTIGRKLALDNPIGFFIYSKVTAASRR
ncbi:Radical SAM domain protein [Paramagnetospirillum magnetotacticum MS-1]|uniref:Radical SAM domain protein n=1 Tax=Paramagnetospirillum magnetotacticum MS-1 TaxID=272627 RepID=A0A0C2V3A6_PARME|nr:radical SAM protein [Paramagnetospirillum magnetotacticum]KIL99571.1 Radical SAM domain protein [Paramagnetospirillum magnetotacticum MS-1]